jgi:GTP-dependent dephospho-CoA kinase
MKKMRIRSLILPESMRLELKSPIGELYEGEPNNVVQHLKRKLYESPPTIFATVGDFVTKNILLAGLYPDIIVIDNKTLRIPIPPIKHEFPEVKVFNAPATIENKVWSILREAVTLKRKLAVVVEGEEDLLVLPLLAEMPFGSVIAYGQPMEGLVVITVSEEKRDWARDFLNRMEEKRS